MPKIKLTLEYDGTDFVGWQYQPNGRSVQEEVEKGLKQILQTDIRITGGGRTDAGVHARGQVASFFLDRKLQPQTFLKSLNSVLPQDVVVRDITEVPLDFHARYSAKSRRYAYFIDRESTAIRRQFCWQVHVPLHIEILQQCASAIMGDHDFSSFCKNNGKEDGGRHHCHVFHAGWTLEDTVLVFNITANRFLYGMVRALVGTMIDVGRGFISADDFHLIMDAKNRSDAGMSAPAKGLFLEEIIY